MSVTTNTMIGLRLPEVDAWSERVVVALGMNPSIMTGPGTNTYLIGSGSRRILLDAGAGRPEYVPVLERALERAGCNGIQEIVVTHAHPDHIGGIGAVLERFGPLRVSKLPWPGADERWPVRVTPIAEGTQLQSEGATLRAIHAPGHAPDHLCFLLEEERALFSGDNVLGVGTTVIPNEGGNLIDYLQSLQRLVAEKPQRIYPAHGPVVADGTAKLREYLAHREDRERQIVQALQGGAASIPEIVKRVYVDVPEVLHGAAAHSVAAHLRKLEHEGRALRRKQGPALEATWSLA